MIQEVAVGLIIEIKPGAEIRILVRTLRSSSVEGEPLRSEIFKILCGSTFDILGGRDLRGGQPSHSKFYPELTFHE